MISSSESWPRARVRFSRFFSRRRQNEDCDGSGQLVFHLQSALDVNLEHEIHIPRELRRSTSSVPVPIFPEHLSVLEKIAPRHHPLELRFIHEIVPLALAFRLARGRVVHEIDSIVPGSCSFFCTSVDFPEPRAGDDQHQWLADRSFDVLHLFPQFLDFGFDLERQPRNFEPFALRCREFSRATCSFPAAFPGKENRVSCRRRPSRRARTETAARGSASRAISSETSLRSAAIAASWRVARDRSALRRAIPSSAIPAAGQMRDARARQISDSSRRARRWCAARPDISSAEHCLRSRAFDRAYRALRSGTRDDQLRDPQISLQAKPPASQ